MPSPSIPPPSPDDRAPVPPRLPSGFRPEVEAALDIFCELHAVNPYFETLERAIKRLHGESVNMFLERLLELPATRVGQPRVGYIDGLIFVGHFFLDNNVQESSQKLLRSVFGRARASAVALGEDLQDVEGRWGEIRVLKATSRLEHRFELAQIAISCRKHLPSSELYKLAASSLPAIMELTHQLREAALLTESLDVAGEALTLLEKQIGGEPYEATHIAWRLIDTFGAVRDLLRAERAFNQAVRYTEFWINECHSPWAHALQAYGDLLLASGEAQSALIYLERALGQIELAEEPDSVSSVAQSLVEALQALGRNDEALSLIREYNLE